MDIVVEIWMTNGRNLTIVGISTDDLADHDPIVEIAQQFVEASSLDAAIGMVELAISRNATLVAQVAGSGWLRRVHIQHGTLSTVEAYKTR